jgi:hypothetical protein
MKPENVVTSDSYGYVDTLANGAVAGKVVVMVLILSVLMISPDVVSTKNEFVVGIGRVRVSELVVIVSWLGEVRGIVSVRVVSDSVVMIVVWLGGMMGIVSVRVVVESVLVMTVKLV